MPSVGRAHEEDSPNKQAPSPQRAPEPEHRHVLRHPRNRGQVPTLSLRENRGEMRRRTFVPPPSPKSYASLLVHRLLAAIPVKSKHPARSPKSESQSFAREHRAVSSLRSLARRPAVETRPQSTHPLRPCRRSSAKPKPAGNEPIAKSPGERTKLTFPVSIDTSRTRSAVPSLLPLRSD